MYEKHFHLSISPFALGPDPRFMYLTGTVREALAILAYGVTARKGFIQLTGDVGTGKTTLLNVFLRWLQEREASTAFIANPHVRPDEFLDIMWADLGMENDSPLKSQRMMKFNRWLLERYEADRLVVVFVDEAQQLSADVLEELRLLTNIETPCHKLLQIVLCGQPELEGLLEHASLRQLRQRITLRCRTEPFAQAQTAEYIRHRLRVAGAESTDIFSPEALRAVHRHSRGIARLINVLCEQSLIESFCDGATTVEAGIVDRAAVDIGVTTGREDTSGRQEESLAKMNGEGSGITSTNAHAFEGSI
jgi:type II secretory pathway predicted ATPase ExeA